MAFLLPKKLTSKISILPSSRHLDLTILTPFFHFTTQTKQKDVPFIAQYLISSFGFSEDRALRVAAHNNLSPIKSSDRPESVVGFLKDIGLTDIQIKNAVSLGPCLLATNVSKTLEPCTHEIIAAGFTQKTLLQLIRYNPKPFSYKAKKLLSRLQFWRDFVGNNEEALLKLIKNRLLIDFDLDKIIIPRITLLREYSLSDQQIAKMIMNMDYLFLQTPDQINMLFKQIENLGFTPGSKMHLEGLIVIASLNKDTFEKKVEFFKETYSWSQEDINLALKKNPRILNRSALLNVYPRFRSTC